MNDLSQTLKAGTLLVIETGEYSDRGWSGPVRVLRDFTKQEAADAFKATFKSDDFDGWREGESPEDFLPWLVAEGWVEAVDNVTSWHVGSYARFEP